MNQQQGFSLIEVLLSLVLVSAVSLALMGQLQQSRQILNQFIARAGASQYLDQVEEQLVVHAQKIPLAPAPYQLKNSSNSLLRVDWFRQWGSLTRSRSLKALIQ